MSRKSRERQPPTEAPAPPHGAAARPDEPAEDFAERRDIETADEPAGEHDRRHHDRTGLDRESAKPSS